MTLSLELGAPRAAAIRESRRPDPQRAAPRTLNKAYTSTVNAYVVHATCPLYGDSYKYYKCEVRV